MILYEALRYLVPELTAADFDPGGVIRIQNDGDGDYIREWNHTAKRPSPDEIEKAMQMPAPVDAAAVKAECGRRIRAVLTLEAQANIAANFAVGALVDDEMSAYKDATTWVREMQETCRAIIAKNVYEFTSDKLWPACPETVAKLAERF